jgi:hypothetical protein
MDKSSNLKLSQLHPEAIKDLRTSLTTAMHKKNFSREIGLKDVRTHETNLSMSGTE